MSRKAKLTNKQRIKAAEEYLREEGGYRSIANKYKISVPTLQAFLTKTAAQSCRKNVR